MAPKFRPNREGIRALGRTPQMARHIEAVGQAVAARAGALAPRRSGDLAGSMEVQVGLDAEGVLVRVVATDWKGIFHEFGTSKMPAHPFLRPALEQVLPGARKP